MTDPFKCNTFYLCIEYECNNPAFGLCYYYEHGEYEGQRFLCEDCIDKINNTQGYEALLLSTNIRGKGLYTKSAHKK
jgi:hypothetical protein